MQSIIVRLIASVLINLAIGGIAFLVEKSNSAASKNIMEETSITVRLPRIYLWMGYLSIIVSVFFIFFVPYKSQTEALLKYFVTTMFFVFGLFLLIGALIWRIEVYEDREYFSYRTVFAKKYNVHYKDCIFYSLDNNILKLKTKNKKFFVDIKSENFQYFYEMLEENNVNSTENCIPNKIIVKLSKGNFIAACFCLFFSSLFLTYMIIFPNDTVNIFTYSMAIIFIILSVLLMLYTILWKIEMPNDENYFLYRTTFGKTYIVNYNDCSFPDKFSAILKLTTKGHSFYIDTKAKNFDIFFTTLQIYKYINKKKNLNI